MSNLELLVAGVQAASTRVLIQAALQRYITGNNTADNWVRASGDLQVALTGGGTSAFLLQAAVSPNNITSGGSSSRVLNVTGTGYQANVCLPYNYPNGSAVYLGDDGIGYPPGLYPNFTYTNTDTLYEGAIVPPTLFLGPLLVNESYALSSITMPIINNTSVSEILGWLTIVVNSLLVFNIANSVEGLGQTGEILLVRPATQNNTFPPGVLYSSQSQVDLRALNNIEIEFVLPPPQNSSRSTRHASRAYGRRNTPFTFQDYPAVEDAFTKRHTTFNNAGSLLSTKNEDNQRVSVGYALPNTPMVDWVLLFEQAYSEAYKPITDLRNILLICVFTTIGVISLLLFPIAHYSVRPIRQLREATKRTVDPYRASSAYGSTHSFHNGAEDGAGSGISDGEVNLEVQARKEGFIERASHWRFGKPRHYKKPPALDRQRTFRIPGKVQDKKHVIHDELTDLTSTFNEMSEELMMQYERLEERVKARTCELEISKKAAEAANESKTLFIANISHELKTPLNGILGMCAVSMGENDPNKIKRSLGIIYKSGDLLLHLLTDLLTFTKNEVGRQLSLEEKEFNLADISSQILSIFDKQAREGSINLQVSFHGPTDNIETISDASTQTGLSPHGSGRVKDMVLWGDQHRILQVLINLVSNSLKFTPPGGSVNVRIRCLGFTEERPGSLRRVSSKLSKQSKDTSTRLSRLRSRVVSGPTSMVRSLDSSEKVSSGDTPPRSGVREAKPIPAVKVRSRSPTPPPENARSLLFEFEVEDTGTSTVILREQILTKTITGPGIPENQQQRVFEPFMQGDLGLSRKYGGTGLGLSICSQLAVLMKGSIGLKSEVGVGSRFTMRIPLLFAKERAESTNSSRNDLSSRRNSTSDEPRTPQRSAGSAESSKISAEMDGAATSSFETPAQPRLVGLSQPFFAASPPMETPQDHLAVIEQVAAQASKRGDKVRVLVAEDNKVNQEVVLRMLRLEDIYGTLAYHYFG